MLGIPGMQVNDVGVESKGTGIMVFGVVIWALSPLLLVDMVCISIL